MAGTPKSVKAVLIAATASAAFSVRPGAGGVVEDLEDHHPGPTGQGHDGGVDLVAVPGPGVAEPAPGRLRALPRLVGDQPAPAQDLVDRGRAGDLHPGQGGVLTQVVVDRHGPVVDAERGTQGQDRGHHRRGRRAGAASGTTRVWRPRAVLTHPGQVPVERGPGDAVDAAPAHDAAGGVEHLRAVSDKRDERDIQQVHQRNRSGHDYP
jgi:hypothetical protein